MNDLFSNLSNYYLTNINIKKIYNNSFFCDNNDYIPNKKQYKNLNSKSKKNDFYIKEKDKLFWYLFIFENGYEAYNLLGRNKYSKEMDDKVNYVKYLKNEKRLLKDFKLKFNDIQENILYNSLNIFSLLAITSIKKINLIYFTDSLYFINNKYDKDPLIIYYDTQNKQYIRYLQDIDDMQYIQYLQCVYIYI